MIRNAVAVAAALVLVPGFAQARRRAPPPPPAPDALQAPDAPQAPRAPQPPRPPHSDWWSPSQFRFDIDVPEMPEFEELEDLELPEMNFPQLFAQADRDDQDDDEDEGHEKDEKGIHVYRMKHDRIRLPRLNIGRDHDELDESAATASVSGNGSATLPVKGPVTFQVRAQGGDLEVVTTDKSQVTIRIDGAAAEAVSLYAFGDRVEPSFRGRRLLRHGKLHVELPKGSRVDVSSMSGDVSVQKLADVRVRTMSGDVKLAQVGKSEVQSISGDVQIAEASGPVRLHLVSGHATVSTTGDAPQLEFQSASGSLDWGGVCAKDCHLSAETVSGEVRLAVDPKSSFELTYTSHSGELRDEVNLAVKRAPRRKSGMAGWGMSGGWLEATFGKGEGTIEADAFSGNLFVKKK